ncbi:MAG: GGDEF domain-containing protein, partial [Pseudomonadota bacterium]
AGDVLLAQVAGYLQRYTRSGDFVARLGGEEFVVLLPGTRIDDAMRIADKLRALIAAASFDYEGQSHAISLSCGIAAVAADDTADSLYKRADEALYAAKDAGRNRCIAA